MKICEVSKKIDQYVSVVLEDEIGKNLVVSEDGAICNNTLVVKALTEECIEKAIKDSIDLIVCYTNMQISAKDPLIRKLIKNDISLYLVKEDLDTSSNGYEHMIAKSLKLADIEIDKITFEENCYKLVTCIPKMEEKHTEKVHQALGKMGVDDGVQGAGYIGTYSQVSDCMYGHQWFMTMPGSDPYVGEVGVLAKIDVERFEMIIPEHQVKACVAKLWEIHPYEEVENDVYPLHEKRNQKGYGRFGTVKSLSIEKIKETLETTLKLENFSSYGKKERVENVAVFASVSSCNIDTILAKKTDILITCSIEEEHILMLNANNINVIVLDSSAMKKLALTNLNDYISSFAKSELFIQQI